MKAFDLIRFNPHLASHCNFIYDTFRRSMNVWPWSAVNVKVLMARLETELSISDVRIATPQSMRDSFIGWYAVRSDENIVVYAFTKYSMRRQGICTSALEDLGIDTGSCFVKFWTPACARIAATGTHLIFDTRGEWDA